MYVSALWKLVSESYSTPYPLHNYLHYIKHYYEVIWNSIVFM